jgi:hypothetical protein
MKMFCSRTLGAIVGIATLIAVPAAWAQDQTQTQDQTQAPDQVTQTNTWGVFRENVLNVPDDQRNCWTQAMVGGDAINGELIAERLTKQQAELALRREARRGLCAAQRTSAGWSARQAREFDHDWSRTNESNPMWSNPRH